MFFFLFPQYSIIKFWLNKSLIHFFLVLKNVEPLIRSIPQWFFNFRLHSADEFEYRGFYTNIIWNWFLQSVLTLKFVLTSLHSRYCQIRVLPYARKHWDLHVQWAMQLFLQIYLNCCGQHSLTISLCWLRIDCQWKSCRSKNML